MSRQTVRAHAGQDRTNLYDEITDKTIAELEPAACLGFSRGGRPSLCNPRPALCFSIGRRKLDTIPRSLIRQPLLSTSLDAVYRPLGLFPGIGEVPAGLKVVNAKVVGRLARSEVHGILISWPTADRPDCGHERRCGQRTSAASQTITYTSSPRSTVS
jgi:hypothetical protein